MHKNQLYLFSNYYPMLPKSIIILPASDLESETSSSIHLELSECIGKGELWMAKDEKTGHTRFVFITSSQEQSPSEDDASKHNTDPLFEKAIELCRKNENVSASLLQTEFEIGYGRAVSLLQKLEKSGFITLVKGRSGRSYIFKEVE